ncbi:pentapeptide repeat-containing protein [Micromonospora sp. NPDC003776]
MVTRPVAANRSSRIPLDLQGTDLAGVDLRNAYLAGANLEDADLNFADLAGADLSQATLRRTELAGAKFDRANLKGASLQRAQLGDAVMTEAVLENADLGSANLQGANLSRANLAGSIVRDAILVGSTITEAALRNADLSGADLSESLGRDSADMTGADLERATSADSAAGPVQGPSASDLIAISPSKSWTLSDGQYLRLGDAHPGIARNWGDLTYSAARKEVLLHGFASLDRSQVPHYRQCKVAPRTSDAMKATALAKGAVLCRRETATIVSFVRIGPRSANAAADEPIAIQVYSATLKSVPSIRLARGPSARSGYWYSITVESFAPNETVTLTCHDTVSPTGFFRRTLRTDANGNAFIERACYSGDGPEHWVRSGATESNHVTWTAAPPPPRASAAPGAGPSQGANPRPPVGARIELVRGSTAPRGWWYNVTLSGFTPNSKVTVTCRDSVDRWGFWAQTFTIGLDGRASDETLCYSADGPDHWITGGGVESNHVGW